MNGQKVLIPIQPALDQTLDNLRRQTTATNAVVIIEDRSKQPPQAVLGTMRGDVDATIEMLSRSLRAMQDQRKKRDLGKSGLILPN